MARAYRLIKRSGERAVLLHSGDLKAGDAVRCGWAYGVVVKTAYTPVTEEVVYVLRHVPEAAVSAAYLHTAYAVLLRGAEVAGESCEKVEPAYPGRGIYTLWGEEYDLIGRGDVAPHLHIVGASGSGKTTLTKVLVSQALAAGWGVFVFDFHGEYGDVLERAPMKIPFCKLNRSALRALLGLHNIAAPPTKLLAYLHYVQQAACSYKTDNIAASIATMVEVLANIDVLQDYCKSQRLDGRGSDLCEAYHAFKRAVGEQRMAMLAHLAKKEQDRIASLQAYLDQAIEALAGVLTAYEEVDASKPVAVDMFAGTLNIFDVAPVHSVFLTYYLQRIAKPDRPTLVVIEELRAISPDESVVRGVLSFLSQVRKFGVRAAVVSQVPDPLVAANSRLVVGAVKSREALSQVKAVAPAAPDYVAGVAKILPRGYFIAIDNAEAVPIRVVV